jgi:hypothetical protein
MSILNVKYSNNEDRSFSVVADSVTTQDGALTFRERVDGDQYRERFIAAGAWVEAWSDPIRVIRSGGRHVTIEPGSATDWG